ncbi:MAG: peptidase domain protein [Clostridia bacterium]|jgi:Zn-dependent M16 (insulinase) family peptidase|nr:peptidase domain protein [Clostridia bacterium]
MIKKSFGILVLWVAWSITSYGAENDFKEMDSISYGKDRIHTYLHEQSGLSVIWIENEDLRKSFTLGVKTPTTDSTGVNHIIEHTVFTGSRAYPSSKLFFDANSAYPNIFMNALTSGDMTIFPFATPYEECYMNLLDVYLDSVFHPDMLNQSNSFYEESFNYNPETKGFGGVVYNEMKGAYSSVDRTIYRSIREAVYQDTHYANDSGGNPNEIPKLTYEQFIKVYQNYYYPSNMKIILYGAIEIDQVLEVIESYVSEYPLSKQEIDLKVDLPKNKGYQKYNVLPEGQKTSLVKSFIISRSLSAAEMQEMDLWINTYLLNTNSLFQQRVREAGFAHVKVFKDDDLPYPIYSIVLQDIDSDHCKVYSDILDHITQEIGEQFCKQEALEKDTLKQAKLALLNSEESPTRGIDIAQSILDGWAHDREIYQYFIKKEKLKKIRTLKTNYAKLLFKDAVTYTLELSPSKPKILNPLTLTQITEKQWTGITEEMLSWQKEKGNPSLKPVSLNQLILKPEINTKIKVDGDQAYISAKLPKGLARSQLYYNTSHIPQEQLPYMFLYAYMLNESAKEETPFKGVLDTKCLAYDNEEDYSPFLKITVLSAEDETNHAALLIRARESLLAKDERWYKHQLVKFVTEFREVWSANVLSALSSLNMGSDKGSKRYLYEQGYPLYAFCEQINHQKDLGWIHKIKEIDNKIYNQKGVVVATTASFSYINPYEASWKNLIKTQPRLEIIVPKYQFSVYPQKSLFVNETQVDYLYLQYTKPKGLLDGTDYLTAAYLTKYYLTPHIRTELGAYGAGCQLNFPDTIALFTYRDPNYKTSLGILKNIPAYLQGGIDQSLSETSKIEALSRVHSQFRLLGSQMEQTDIQERLLMMGIKKDYIEQLQYQILEATPKDIEKKCTIFQTILDKGALGIATHYGNEAVGNYRLYHFK